MGKIILNDGEATFEALLLEAAHPVRLVLFAAGSGGNPERHLPLLESLAARGSTVIAPCFDRLVSPQPAAEELLLRARRLRLALDSIGATRLPTLGVGHSIGATLLLALAGAQMWMREGERLALAQDERLKKLVLFTPPTGYFQAPNALDSIQLPIQAWAGALDPITPPRQVEFLETSLRGRSPIEVRLVEGAGHFSFMNTLPPQVADPMADRDAFLESLAGEVGSFIEA